MDFKEYRFIDVATLINGRAYLMPELQDSGKYKIVRVGNFTGKDEWFYSDMELEPDKYCEDGDLLYKWACTFGPEIWKGGKTIYHYHIWKVLCSPHLLDKKFFFYYLKYHTPFWLSGTNGATMVHITKASMEKKRLSLPPLPIQQKVASILSAYDSQIENNQKRIKLLEQMAENLYKEWFVRFRFPGYENAEFEGGVPKGWTRCKLGDLIDFQNGFAFKSETFVPEGKYKVITIKNVQDGQFDSSNADRVEDIPKGMPSYCKLSEGDILLSLTGNVGRVCHVIGNNMLLNQRVAKIKSSHSHFAYCMLRTPAMFAYLNMIAYGTAQLNLSPIKAANLKIIKPTESIMEAFDKVVAPLFSSVFNLYNQIDFLSSQRDLLLPRLMSGKLSI